MSARRVGRCIPLALAVAVAAIAATSARGQNAGVIHATRHVVPEAIEEGDSARVQLTVHGASVWSSACLPFTSVVLIDNSSSMAVSDPGGARWTAANVYVQNLLASCPNAKVGLIVFSDSVSVAAQPFNDPNVISALIDTWAHRTQSWGTNVPAALDSANAMLSREGAMNKVALLFSDGGAPLTVNTCDSWAVFWGAATPGEKADTTTLVGLKDVVDEAQEKGYEYSTVGFSTADEGLLHDQIAAVTGGRYCTMAGDASALVACLDQVFQDAVHSVPAQNVSLHERVNVDSLRIRPYGVSFDIDTSNLGWGNQLNSFPTSGVLDLELGELPDKLHRSISFFVSPRYCPPPEAPESLLVVGVAPAGQPNVTYLLGGTPQQVLVPGATLACRRPGALRATKQYDADSARVVLELKNMYQASSTRDNTIREIQVREMLGPMWVSQPDSVSTSVSVPSTFIWITDRPNDRLLWRIPALAPGATWRATIGVVGVSCPDSSGGPYVLDQPDSGTVLFRSPRGDSTVAIPQEIASSVVPRPACVRASVHTAAPQWGRPDELIRSALSYTEYLDPLGTRNPRGSTHPVDDSPDIFVDASVNGYVGNWQDVADISAHLAGASGFGYGLSVAAQGDVLDFKAEARVYARAQNVGSAPADSGRVRLLVWDSAQAAWTPLADAWRAVAPPGAVRLVQFDLPAGSMRSTHITSYGLQLPDFLRVLAEASPSDAEGLSHFLQENPDVQKQLSRHAILPRDLPPALGHVLDVLLAAHPELRHRFERPSVRLRVEFASATGELHTSNNVAEEVVLVHSP